MARLEAIGENHEVFVMSKAEYAELVALLTAAIQGAAQPRHPCLATTGQLLPGLCGFDSRGWHRDIMSLKGEQHGSRSNTEGGQGRCRASAAPP